MENKVWCITRYNDYYETYCLVVTRTEVNGFVTKIPLLFVNKDMAQQVARNYDDARVVLYDPDEWEMMLLEE